MSNPSKTLTKSMQVIVLLLFAGCKQSGKMVDYSPASPIAAIVHLPDTPPVKDADSLTEASFDEVLQTEQPIAFEGIVIVPEGVLPKPLYLEIYRADDHSRAPIQTAVATLTHDSEQRWRYRIDVKCPYKSQKTDCKFRIGFGQEFVGRGSLTIEPPRSE